MPKESIYYYVPDIHNKQDYKRIKSELDTLAGVNSVSIKHDQNIVTVDYDSTGVTAEKITSCLKGLGVKPEKINRQEHIM